METGRNVMHYALGDNQDYEHEWSKAVLEYLENGYSSEDSKSEVEVGNTTYKILKREKVTAFYDADGNTLFDIENDRLKEEYEAMDFSASEPQSEMGKAISNIEQQAFEQAVNDDIDADDTIPMGTASLKEIVEGIPAPTPEEIESAKENNNSSVYIGVVGAVTKLQEELKKAKDKSFADPIIKHLIERCRGSESLASDVCQDHKTWEKCYKYIYKQAREDAKRFNQTLKKLRKETKDVEAMNLNIEGLFIRLPNRLEELKKEGEALHHCVGTYMERVRKGETMIFFIRRKEEPEKPYYTLEWHGKVVQCRGSHNCDMTPEVKAFVQIFQEKMTEYASEPPKHRKAG